MNRNNPFPKRQVHLDFHTSPDLRGIGGNFDEEKFIETLKLGHVNSITVFAKCHHGVCYFPTKVGTPHPNLVGDLTGNMIRAAHKAGVRAPVYITAGWSDLDHRQHPEWLSINKKGEPQRPEFANGDDENSPRPEAFWHALCLNDGPYCEHIYALTEEVCKRYDDLDGLFYDICFIEDACYCPTCIEGMKREGYDPENDADARKYYDEKHIAFMQKCGAILKKYHPDATIFFNSGGAEIDRPVFHPYETHYELEDLPTVWGGYDKMPIRSKFFAKLGKPAIGMTGKFHLCWGEFGGFKTKEALRYEVVSMMMNGVGCSIGDQMLFDGTLDRQTYENIGYAYSYIEENEEYFGGGSVAKLGIIFSDDRKEDEGLACILAEKQIDFDLILDGKFDGFDAVILPSTARLTEEGADALAAYAKRGGKILAIGEALRRFPKIAEAIGIRSLGASPCDCDYIQSLLGKKDNIPDTPFLAYYPAERIASEDATLLAEVLDAKFNRTYLHFCGHKNTPYDEHDASHPALLQKGNAVVVAHDIPKMYHDYGCVAHKLYFLEALSLIYTPDIKVSLGSQARVALFRQEEKSRYAFHLTYVSPIRRGAAEIIDDVPTLKDVDVSVKVGEKIKSVTLVGTGEKLPFIQSGDEISFTIPKLWLHAIAVLEF